VVTAPFILAWTHKPYSLVQVFVTSCLKCVGSAFRSICQIQEET
jgi:hypothetical protein